MSVGSRKVAYFYDDNVPNYYYGHDHPMKPKRIGMTHSLINHYKMYSLLHVYEPAKASREDLCMFHTPEYVEYLEKVNPKTFTRGTEKKIPLKLERLQIALYSMEFLNLVKSQQVDQLEPLA